MMKKNKGGGGENLEKSGKNVGNLTLFNSSNSPPKQKL